MDTATLPGRLRADRDEAVVLLASVLGLDPEQTATLRDEADRLVRTAENPRVALDRWFRERLLRG